METVKGWVSSITSTGNQQKQSETADLLTSKIVKESSDYIGLDFGNSNICVSYYKDQIFNIFQLETSRTFMPSWLTIKENGEFFVGTAAKNTQKQKTTSISVFDLRRCLIHKKTLNQLIPFTLDGNGNLQQSNTAIPLVRAIAVLLHWIKEKIDNELKLVVKNVVLAVPIGLDIHQYQILIDACTIAGFCVKDILYESVATAITYYVTKEDIKNTICVIDFGGAKLEVAIVKIDNGKIELLDYASNLILGGRDFDECLLNFVLNEIKQQCPTFDLQTKHVNDIRSKCIIVKENLSSRAESSVDIDIGSDDISVDISRETFEAICKDLFFASFNTVCNVVQKYQNVIDDILLVGGSTRMPKFQRDILFRYPQLSLNETINAEEAVAKGAAIHGTSLSGLIKKLQIKAQLPWHNACDLVNPSMEIFVDNNGEIQRKIFENAKRHFVNIQHEIMATKAIFVKNDETIASMKPVVHSPQPNIESVVSTANSVINEPVLTNNKKPVAQRPPQKTHDSATNKAYVKNKAANSNTKPVGQSSKYEQQKTKKMAVNTALLDNEVVTSCIKPVAQSPQPKTEHEMFYDKIMEPSFAHKYQKYNIMALDYTKNLLKGQNFEKADIMEFCMPRIKICLEIIELYQKWQPTPPKLCASIEKEMKILCATSHKMEDLSIHLLYLHWCKYALEQNDKLLTYKKEVQGQLKQDYNNAVMHLNDINSILQKFFLTNSFDVAICQSHKNYIECFYTKFQPKQTIYTSK